MKIYEFTIKPLTGFGTPLKGDTIFGHICWQAAYDDELFGKPLFELLKDYRENPFIVVSSAFFKSGQNGQSFRVFKRPDVPFSYLFDLDNKNTKDVIAERKILKSKKWLKLEISERIESLKKVKYVSDGELIDILKKGGAKLKSKEKIALFLDFTQPRNTINRLTNTTGEGRFAPFTVNQIVFNDALTIIIFVGISNDIKKEQVFKAFQRIGETGFGKDASSGLGKFNVVSVEEINLSDLGSKSPNACYILSPCIPEKNIFSDIFFTPFTRFGRHGDILAKSRNPFKNPVLMADEGAIMIPKDINDVLKRPYIGKAITGVSKVKESTVVQGYSLYIPVRLEA